MMRPSLTLSERKALRELFDQYDTSKDFWLDAKELKNAMQKAGLVSSTTEAYRFIAQADKDADGKIDFGELQDWIIRQRQKKQEKRSRFSLHLANRMSELEEKYKLDDRVEDVPILWTSPSNTIAHHKFDSELHAKILVIFNDNKGQNGELDMFEFMKALKQAGEFTQTEMCMLLVKADQNGDTNIDFNEFISMLWSNRDRLTITDQWSQRDKGNKTVQESIVLDNGTEEERASLNLPTLGSMGTFESVQEIEIDQVSVEEAKESKEHQPEEMDGEDAHDEETFLEETQDDKKIEVEKHDNDDKSVLPQLASMNFLPKLSAEDKSRILASSIDLLLEFDKLKITHDQQHDILTRLIAFRKSEGQDFIDLCSAEL